MTSIMPLKPKKDKIVLVRDEVAAAWRMDQKVWKKLEEERGGTVAGSHGDNFFNGAFSIKSTRKA